MHPRGATLHVRSGFNLRPEFLRGVGNNNITAGGRLKSASFEGYRNRFEFFMDVVFLLAKSPRLDG